MNSKKLKGFTFVELVTVITIVSILSLTSVIAYKEYLKKAVYTEGKSLVASIIKAQKIYYAQHNTFYGFSGNFSQELDIDARNNKYFKFFETIPGGIIPKSNGSYQKNVKQRFVANYSYVIIYCDYFHPNGQRWTVETKLYLDGHFTEYKSYEEKYDET